MVHSHFTLCLRALTTQEGLPNMYGTAFHGHGPWLVCEMALRERQNHIWKAPTERERTTMTGSNFKRQPTLKENT